MKLELRTTSPPSLRAHSYQNQTKHFQYMASLVMQDLRESGEFTEEQELLISSVLDRRLMQPAKLVQLYLWAPDQPIMTFSPIASGLK